MKHIKKILALALVIMSVFAIAAPALAAYSTMYVDGDVGVGSTVRLRKTASTSGTVLANIPYGTAVQAEYYNSTWHKVTWTNPSGITFNGYMMSSYLSTSAPGGLPWVQYYGSETYKKSSTYKSGVVHIQEDLNDYFYNRGDTAYSWYPLSMDGYFGNDTDSAVRRFQALQGLTVDGYVGNQTKERLYSIIH